MCDVGGDGLVVHAVLSAYTTMFRSAHWWFADGATEPSVVADHSLSTTSTSLYQSPWGEMYIHVPSSYLFAINCYGTPTAMLVHVLPPALFKHRNPQSAETETTERIRLTLD